MSAPTLPPPARPAPPPAAPRPNRSDSPRRTAPPGSRLAVRRTLLAYLACAIGILPLKEVVSDSGWLVDAWVAMAIVVVPAVLLRTRRGPSALDIWPGIVLLVPYLTARFLADHAWGGIIPTSSTWHDVTGLMTALHRTTRTEIAPVHSTIAIRLVLCALLGLLVALVDLIAVVGRRGALAGVPLLVVFTISGAVPRHPVSWVWFVFGAVGFLILLGLDAGGDLDDWGRRIHGPTRRPTARTALSGSARRIAIIAVAVAVVLPLVVPAQSRNVIANIFHTPHQGLVGFGTTGGTISPFAVLRGQLDEGTPISVATVHMLAGDDPYYLRVNVLSDYTSNGWQVADHGATQPVSSTSFASDPPQSGHGVQQMAARVTITGLEGNAPVFADPVHLQDLSSGTTWSGQDQLLLGDPVASTDRFVEEFAQPNPTLRALEAAPERVPASARPFEAVPSDFPSFVTKLVTKLTRTAHGPYERARALQAYFTDPAHGFTYDLRTPVGDSGSALVDFLQHKRGFCQQYAAAMAIMLRVAHVPSRVVLGYMHPVANIDGDFEIDSNDAHAWVEAYFAGIGWIPFDPTPLAGLADAGASDPAWAPHGPVTQGGGNQDSTAPHPNNTTGAPKNSTAPKSTPASSGDKHRATTAAPSSGGGITGGLIVGVIVLAALALAAAPALVRRRRRRQRLGAARRDGDAEALWDELGDTAVDLGFGWSAARSPRQVATRLERHVHDSRRALWILAGAVERYRYSPPAVNGAMGSRTADPRELAESLHKVRAELWRTRSLRTRVRAAMWPASLWGGNAGGTALPGWAGLLLRSRRH